MCRRRWLILICALVLLIITTSLVLAQSQSAKLSPYIYKVKIAGCSSEPKERRQTGFRVKDKKGIVTALHGVVGCETINAEPGVNDAAPFNDLVIAAVDIDRDMALLWSPQLEAASLEGFSAITDTKDSNYKGLHVIGYPLDLSQQKSTTQITVTETTELGNLVSEELITPLAKRGSPALAIKVLSVEGHLLPGHSGAPLLNGNNQVAGVANGGLDHGADEIAWAIPWEAIAWKVVSPKVGKEVSWADVQRLEPVKGSENEQLFAFTKPEDVGEQPTTPVVITVGDYVQVMPLIGLKLRESPGTNAALVVGANKNSILEVIDGPKNEDGVDWWQVRKIDGEQVGWVAYAGPEGAYYLQPVPQIGKSSHVMVTAPSGLHRFKSPNSGSNKLDVLNNGEELRVIAEPLVNQGKVWCLVSKGNDDAHAGWVIFADQGGIYLVTLPNTDILTATSTATPTTTKSSTPTATPITPTPTFTNTSTATLTSAPTSSQATCGNDRQIALKRELIDTIRKTVVTGATEVFAHCPPFSSIRYKDVTVDDKLVKVELVCYDTSTDITERFSRVAIAGAMLPHYESQPLDIPTGCRIDFTVQDVLGENVGIDIQAVVVDNSPTNTPTSVSVLLLPTTEPDPYWLSEISGIPESGKEYSIELSSGQILLFSGGEFQYQNNQNKFFCGAGANNICVLVYKATKPQTITFTKLYEKANYIGVSDTYSPEQAVAQKIPQFWQRPNCETGCKTAIIYYVQDGKVINRQTLSASK